MLRQFFLLLLLAVGQTSWAVTAQDLITRTQCKPDTRLPKWETSCKAYWRVRIGDGKNRNEGERACMDTCFPRSMEKDRNAERECRSLCDRVSDFDR